MNGFFNKPTGTISSLAREASCSHGWLRLVVQAVFFGITVASFVLILLMAMRPSQLPPKLPSRCDAANCIVTCHGAPFYDKFKNDIVAALTETETRCARVSLRLHYPYFVNGTLPNWTNELSGFSVFKLAISGGNLRHIPANGFMGQFAGNIKTLVFDNITINQWESNSLVGLSHLNELYITRSEINNIERDALRPVDDILEKLTIIFSGAWSPDKLTGTGDLVKLKTVVLANNNFSNILNRRSFVALKKCEILYLNSCEITSIGAGTFDKLVNIHILYLNDNHLLKIPPKLFDGLRNNVNPISRINLNGNPWICDCDGDYFRVLSEEGMLLVEPTCYYPKRFRGLPFAEFYEQFCNNCSSIEVLFVEEIQKKKTMSLTSDLLRDNNCLIRREPPPDSSVKIISPVYNYKCDTGAIALSKLTLELRNIEDEMIFESSWLQPTLLMKSDKYYLIETDLLVSETHGLMWYQASCPSEIYCVATLPNSLKIYNTNISSWYVFCPWELRSGSVAVEECIMYDLSKMFDADKRKSRYFLFRLGHIMFYIGVGIASLLAGALLVYVAILVNPALLKGSKRLLFVKYKDVAALVLPPKVPLRSTQSENFAKKDSIFLLPSNSIRKNFGRSKSIRSNSSDTPSYISVIQPSEDQLPKWRTESNFDSENSNISFYRRTSLPYVALDNESVTLHTF